MKLYEKQIRRVLTLLEASVDTESHTQTVRELAEKHVQNQQKVLALQKKIDALVSQQQDFENINAKIEDEIKTMLDHTVSQTIRFGKILVEFEKKTVSGVSKSSPQYKAIVEDIKMTYGIEDRIITDLMDKYNNGNKPFKRTDVNLSITKESKQLKENLIRNLWYGIKGVFTKLFSSFKIRVEDLEQRIAQL